MDFSIVIGAAPDRAGPGCDFDLRDCVGSRRLSIQSLRSDDLWPGRSEFRRVVPPARPSWDLVVRAANKLSSFAADIFDAEGFGAGRGEPIWALVSVVGSADDFPCTMAICLAPRRLD